MSMPATASARVHPVRAMTTALTITATEPRASLTTSRKAARMFRFAPRPALSTAMEAMLPSRPMTPKTSRPVEVTSGGANRRWTPSTKA